MRVNSPLRQGAAWLVSSCLVEVRKSVTVSKWGMKAGSSFSKVHINQSLETALSGEPILTDNRSLQMGPLAGQYI